MAVNGNANRHLALLYNIPPLCLIGEGGFYLLHKKYWVVRSTKESIMIHEPIVFRRFCPDDLPEIMRIQHANQPSNLSRAEQADGFLSAEFSSEQFARMHREIPMVVADCGLRLGGYMCGCSLASCATVPLMAHMATLFPVTSYKSKPLNQYRNFIYGPVCVERPLRGKGILEGLFREYKAQLAGQFDIGILFVSLANPRSLQAHIHKLGMCKLCEFSFSGREYGLLIFDAAG